jgi:hypothetical protein
MTYSLPALETRLSRLLKGDAEDLIAALPVAGWLSACGRSGSDQLLSAIKGNELDPSVLILGRISEAEADLEQTEGIDLGLTLAQIQGLILIATKWNLATEEINQLASLANEVILDDQAAEWIEQWNDEVPLDPLDDLTLPSIAFPVSFNQTLIANILLNKIGTKRG